MLKKAAGILAGPIFDPMLTPIRGHIPTLSCPFSTPRGPGTFGGPPKCPGRTWIKIDPAKLPEVVFSAMKSTPRFKKRLCNRSGNGDNFQQLQITSPSQDSSLSGSLPPPRVLETCCLLSVWTGGSAKRLQTVDCRNPRPTVSEGVRV